jgi:hypothetical protein
MRWYSIDEIRERITKIELARRAQGVWKYFEFLPLASRSSMVSLGETHCRKQKGTIADSPREEGLQLHSFTR